MTGASRGIGKATAIAFAQAGARVAVHYSQDQAAAAAVQESLSGAGHCVVQADIADAVAVERMVGEAIASYDQALAFKPDYAKAFYNKAHCYSSQNQVELAVECLQQAIALDPKCKDWAKTDTDFDLIRESDRFQALIEH